MKKEKGLKPAAKPVESKKRLFNIISQAEGITGPELLARTGLPEPEFKKALLRLLDSGSVTLKEGRLYDSAQAKKNRLSPLEKQTLAELENEGFWGLSLKRIKDEAVTEALETLVEEGKALLLDEDIVLERRRFQQLCRTLLQGRKAGEELTIEETRRVTGLSRRYILPLFQLMEEMEYLSRHGDQRTISQTGLADLPAPPPDGEKPL